jgi:hypothetical protein
MRSAGNFHPEWGYLAPAPSFLRTARVALVATAIGATAGAVVVVSLVAHPGANDDNSSIAAHALVTAAPIVTSSAASAPLAGQAKATPNSLAQASTTSQSPQAPAVRTAVQPQAPAGKPEPDNFASASKLAPVAAPVGAAPPNATALADTAPADVTPSASSPDSIMVPEDSPTKKGEFKRHRPSTAESARRWQAEAKKRWHDNRGLGPLFRLFSFRDSSSYDN